MGGRGAAGGRGLSWGARAAHPALAAPRVVALSLALAACCLCPGAQAQPGEGRGHGHANAHAPGPAHRPAGRPAWHGDIRQFHAHDWNVWRGGHWFHGPHLGRPGWWWVVGSVWYFYPTPVYPYPNPYEPPPAVLVTPPMDAPPPPPSTQYWYFCERAQGYYPYVPTCPGGWRQVPATPAGAAPAPPPGEPR